MALVPKSNLFLVGHAKTKNATRDVYRVNLGTMLIQRRPFKSKDMISILI